MSMVRQGPRSCSRMELGSKGNATAGAVNVDGSERQAHSILVPESLVSHWLEEAGDQIISRTELWASVILKWSFRERLCNCRVIAWIDNEAARACAIKANSPSPTMRALARMTPTRRFPQCPGLRGSVLFLILQIHHHAARFKMWFLRMG